MSACWTCKSRVEMPGAKVCNDCWEVERRLEGYLYRGGFTATHFVSELLDRVKRTQRVTTHVPAKGEK